VLGGGLYAGWAYYLADRSAGPMLIVGRRGDVANWPENTIPGIRSAARFGADGIEFDIRQSADGTFYLMHDREVDRTTNGSGAIKVLHDAEIEGLAIDGGLGFQGQSGIRVPRLVDVLHELAQYDGALFLDAKGDAVEHAALAALVAPLDVNARISCSTSADVIAVGGLLPTYGGRGTGVDKVMLGSPLPWTAWFWPVQVSAIYEGWTGDERDAMARARRWGVEVYITNDLEAVLTFGTN
jgi:hypothetical protein